MDKPRPAEKILFVDDDPNILASFLRQLRNNFAVNTALGGAQALEMLERQGPYAVMVSDFKMPGMDGVQLLNRCREMAPDTVRMLLTGYADVETSIRAVNEGNIFRLLTKPIAPEDLLRALVAAIKQHRLVNAEKELLEKTLQGSIKLVSDVLSLADPASFGRSSRLVYYMAEISRHLLGQPLWEMITATMLCQLGYLTLPEKLRHKLATQRPLNAEEQALYQRHPLLAAEMIAAIPRMEPVAEIIRWQERPYQGAGEAEPGPQAEELPLGSRILKVLLDFDGLVNGGQSKGKALLDMQEMGGAYDPQVLAALTSVLGSEADFDSLDADVYQLKEGMILDEDLRCSRKGRLLLAKGNHLNAAAIQFIRNYNRINGVRQPVRVLVPLSKQPARVADNLGAPDVEAEHHR